jgi:hypothetical protein
MVAWDIVGNLRLEMRQPSTDEAVKLVFPKEQLIEPLGQVEVKWCFRGKQKFYKSLFWVLDMERFDLLIGGSLIGEYKLFKQKAQS